MKNELKIQVIIWNQDGYMYKSRPNSFENSPDKNGNWGPLRETPTRFRWDIEGKWLNIIGSRKKSIFHDSLMLQKKKYNSVLWSEPGPSSPVTCDSCLPLPNWKSYGD